MLENGLLTRRTTPDALKTDRVKALLRDSKMHSNHIISTTDLHRGIFEAPLGSTSAIDDPWCVLHIRTNHEKRVAQHLSVRSVEYYLPLYTERSRWTDRTVVLERPLFPGYMFARFPTQARVSVISAPGVIHLLSDDEKNKVSAAEIDRIREGLANGCLLRPHPYVSMGTPVRVRSGVFESVEGIVTELRNRCRVVIALSVAKQCFSLEMDLKDLEILGRPDEERK